MIKGLRLFRFFVFLLVTGGILGTCGIEDYPYLNPVDPGIPLRLNTTAFVRLPALSADQREYFRNFVIYYRIYISGLSVSGTVSTEQMAQINSALSTDYNYFLPYTTANTTDITVPTTMGTMFSNRKYYALAFENTSTESTLGSGATGSLITLDFARPSPLRPAFFFGDTRENPSITPINLWRYSESGIMHPYADNRYFTNSNDLNTGDYIDQSTFTNLDVANNTVSGPKYTYVSMYIMAYGIDNNFSNIYSSPTFIGVFLLPD
jgi:hypothetical protein